MNKIEIYTKDWCPFCAGAKTFLQSENIEYSEIDVTSDLKREQEMIQRSGRFTVPQIFIDGASIGGYDDLVDLNASGELDQLLSLTPALHISKVQDEVAVNNSANVA